MFRYYNANEFGHDIADCTIRAISVAEGISWDKAYRKISDYARERGLMMSSVENIEQYLDDNYQRVCEPDMTVGEFAYMNPKGRFLITMPRTHNHNKGWSNNRHFRLLRQTNVVCLGSRIRAGNCSFFMP